MTPVSFTEARECVLREVRAAGMRPQVEIVPVLDAGGRVLAVDVPADRDYPPVARSVRDGFALRAADADRTLHVIGEVRAGESFAGAVQENEAVEIMTGAPVPSGADAVVMVEHVVREGDNIRTDRSLSVGENISPQGSEARKGQVVAPAGRRLDFASIALLASVGCSRITVFRRPSVAILATGDEIVPVDEAPREFEVRNSNAWSLAVQVARAGGIPEVLEIARDTYASTLQQVEQGLSFDLLLLSGGVSAGKYDIVERVLADCGAEFFFDRVRVQPGQPLVFGKARDKFFFGLPGNPASTMVTFEVFARAAVELLSGQTEPALPILNARLAAPFRHKTGLTRFLPALLDADGSLAPMRWAGSGDVTAMARANAFLVADPERESWESGDWIQVLLK